MVRAPNEKKTNLIPPEKNPEFFKIYLPDHSSQRLKIPPAFLNHFNGLIPNKAILRSRKGRIWHVELEQVDSNLFFQDGWKGFVKDQSLKLGEFLVFIYDGNSVFDVKIFGINGCEKQETLVYKNYDQAASNLKKEEQPESEEIINNYTPFKQKFPELRGKRIRRPKYGSRRAKIIEEMVLKAAGFAKPKNPYFVASFLPGRPYELFIPRELVTKHRLKIMSEMTLRDPSGRNWSVKTSRWKDGRISLSKGWSILCKENNLGIDDKCIFEFIEGRGRKFGIIQVHIIWAGAGTSVPNIKAKQEASLRTGDLCTALTNSVNLLD
ncbi:putative B3 domain-containing protein At5g66980 [Macadamia integrifolia]|uniref:putative B3 domain-containing protein At5g66980 n=1 Tax=Macadamia integrifolia TaxID=60698 RepID=UPI001C4FB8CF|nr:putative B3 domain-containing protein At5g66980 [Macadamia integrifolia]